MSEPETEPSRKTKVEEFPLPTMLFSCMNGDCACEASWPAEDLHWFPKVQKWICIECRDSEIDGEPTYSLRDTLRARILHLLDDPVALFLLLKIEPKR